MKKIPLPFLWPLLIAIHSHGKAEKPNFLVILVDDMGYSDLGCYGGEIDTPHLDGLAANGLRFTQFYNTGRCWPTRGSLLTGYYAQQIRRDSLPGIKQAGGRGIRPNWAPLLPEFLSEAGYRNYHSGKWHIDGTGRSAYIPPERRQGFDYWKVLECTHNYNKSRYYDKTGKDAKMWEGYDAYAQTRDAVAYIRKHAAQPAESRNPFGLFLSWGPPHAPYRTGPAKWLDHYDNRKLTLRGNVPPQLARQAQSTYAGYYAHCSALDECVGWLVEALRESGELENTILVYTSDHGDMLHSRGQLKKQRPWDESIRVPFLVRCPSSFKVKPRRLDAPINTPDIMPTLLSLAGVEVPASVEGEDFAGVIRGTRRLEDNHALITCPSPFGQWTRAQGGREYRGLRTRRYTYTRSLDGPWELFDNQEDPFQQKNLIGSPRHHALRDELEDKLKARLTATGDDFASGEDLIKRCGYRVDPRGTVGYRDQNGWGQVSVPART